MAAPSTTVWGDIVGGYGRIGLNIGKTTESAKVYIYVEVWFWSKYSLSDTSNTLCCDLKDSINYDVTSLGSVNISTTVSSGDGWSTSNQKLLKSVSYSVNLAKTASNKYICAKLINVDRVGGTMYANVKVPIPAKANYNVSYNANGGSGAPSSQTKWYNETLTLSTAKPTRTGYTFQGWATSASGSVAYASGANYTSNAKVTLYAVWKANTYTVKYDANGGTGAPSNQTKTHGTALTLSSTKPTKANYTFKGWGTSASSTTVAYAAGASYTANAAVTLYAIWELAYVKPRIFNLSATRCTADGTPSDTGTSILLHFNWACDSPPSRFIFQYIDNSNNADQDWHEKTASDIGAAGLTNGIYNSVFSAWNGWFSPDSSYTIEVLIDDGIDTNSANTTLPGSVFPIDFLAGGKGVAFGKPAELQGVADFGFDAKFNKPVYGKALGMDRLPAIPSNADLNTYMEPGCYAVQSNAISETCANIPVARAGRLEVWSSTGEGIRPEQWSYLRQRFIPYNSSNAVWERDITRVDDNVWRFNDWWRSSLTPIAAEKVYTKAAMTIAMNATTTLGGVNTDTKIPFDKVVLSTSNRLTMQDNSIRIGANIDYVKVSGQALVGCGNTNGLRHVRIRKVSSGTSKSVSWVTAYGTADNQAIYPLTPVIVSVQEGDLLDMVFYTGNSADKNSAGSDTNGWQSYMTVEEL